MRRIDIAFILLSVACLMVGVVLGIGMGIAHNFQFAPVHAHVNLVGWASLALFGLVYKSYPALAQSRLALAHFTLASVSAVLFPIGIYFALAHDFPALAIGASLLWLAGVLVFFVNLLRVFVLAGATGGGLAGERALA